MKNPTLFLVVVTVFFTAAVISTMLINIELRLGIPPAIIPFIFVPFIFITTKILFRKK